MLGYLNLSSGIGAKKREYPVKPDFMVSASTAAKLFTSLPAASTSSACLAILWAVLHRVADLSDAESHPFRREWVDRGVVVPHFDADAEQFPEAPGTLAIVTLYVEQLVSASNNRRIADPRILSWWTETDLRTDSLHQSDTPLGLTWCA